jgi:hypothetical protein
MASRLYYPTLVRILHKVCLYIVRYRTQLESALTDAFGEGAVTALNAVVVACEAFTAIVELTENP